MARHDPTEQALALAASERDTAALAALADWYAERGKEKMARACRWMRKYNTWPTQSNTISQFIRLDGCKEKWCWANGYRSTRRVRTGTRPSFDLHSDLFGMLHRARYASESTAVCYPTWLSAVRDLADTLDWLRRLTDA